VLFGALAFFGDTSGSPISADPRAHPDQPSTNPVGARPHPADLNPIEPAFHYRPESYELWEFVRWDGDDRLLLKVTWHEGNDPTRELVTLPAEVVHLRRRRGPEGIA